MFLYKLEGKSEKMLVEPAISSTFSFIILFCRVHFSENVKNFISNNMSYEKYESNRNYRFFIGRIISKNSQKQLKSVYRFWPQKSKVFSRLRLFVVHFIQNKIFHISAEKLHK